ncbi:D-alanyl-D-alanine carboxypeptidase dacC precursor [Kingella potus]|uniref:serine-type D-Ala-D-Ala carboxypeptidase n=1 Tax=Kingella potus TaxID=265175 RepID=A0A377R0F5_9NEIS|nr:D-alanyl-D-alanine carboxypeptidase family protein [Kingella potus]STR00983.1 D-alanyl-D-alanine carboxypeptidase dacC precursor [Kingella potus]
MMKKYLVLTAIAAALVFQTASAANYKKRHHRYKKRAVAAAPAAAGAAAAAAAPEQAASAPEDILPAEPKPQASSAPEIAAAAYLVQDLQSGQILTGKDLDKPVEPASLTKLMTAYLAFKALESGKLKADDMLTPSENAWRAEGSRMFLNAGKPVSVGDLLKGLIVQSGNDAAITLAEALGGSESGFAAMMNDEAKRLGMNGTRFTNATGLPDDGHLTTVRDLAILSAAIIKDYPKYYPIYSMQSFKYNNIEQPNRNLLLYRDPNVDGLKTGHTNSAGYNLVASSKRNGRRVVSVVVGTESIEARAGESSRLLNWALQAFDTPKAYDAGKNVSSAKVYKGRADNVSVGFSEPVYVTIPHGEGSKVKTVLETVQPVVAPIEKGQVLGKLKISYDGKVLAERPVVALEAVEEAGFFGRLWDSVKLWFKNMFADR